MRKKGIVAPGDQRTLVGWFRGVLARCVCDSVLRQSFLYFYSRIVRFFWNDPSDTATWLNHITSITRYDVDMQVRNCLAARFTDVDPDVVTIRLMVALDGAPCMFDGRHEFDTL